MSLNQLLDAMSHDIASLSGLEKFLGGLLVTAFSMSIVFLVLILLMGITKAMDIFMHKVEAKAQGKIETPLAAGTSAGAEKIFVQEDGIAPEEVAAIMAAISMMGGSGSRFVVRQIQRTSPAIPSWSQAAMGCTGKRR